VRRAVVAIVAVAALLTGCGDADDGQATSPTAVEPTGTSETVADGGASATTTTVDALTRPDVGIVVRVLDGDTADIDIGGDVERVRFIGIDTPEPLGGFRDPECFGDEASAFTAALLPEGTLVRLERDVEGRDPFDRLLAYVFRFDDDLFVNLTLAEQGYADTLRIEPNTAYSSLFSGAVADARDLGLGLWGACGSADQPLGG
jgi:micrococcal nuclease